MIRHGTQDPYNAGKTVEAAEFHSEMEPFRLVTEGLFQHIDIGRGEVIALGMESNLCWYVSQR